MHFVDAKGILSATNGMNLYRGCTHGCIYCDSRSKCYGFTHKFEDIEVKQNAPELLDQKLRSKRKKCMISTGYMCDSYMHCEEKLQLTRRCLALIEQYGFGVDIQTKSDRVLRDLDLLKKINQKAKAVVQITLTTADDALCKILEPNVCVTSRRVEVLKELQKEGIPTVVWMSPILPYINDTEENITQLLAYCVETGVKGIVNMGMGVTLREGSREHFYAALDRHFPGLSDVYRRQYGTAYELLSPNQEKLRKLLTETCEKAGILYQTDEVFAYLKAFPEEKGYQQMSLFDFCEGGKE